MSIAITVVLTIVGVFVAGVIALVVLAFANELRLLKGRIEILKSEVNVLRKQQGLPPREWGFGE